MTWFGDGGSGARRPTNIFNGQIAIKWLDVSGSVTYDSLNEQGQLGCLQGERPMITSLRKISSSIQNQRAERGKVHCT